MKRKSLLVSLIYFTLNLGFSQKLFDFEHSWDYFIQEKGQFERRIKEQYHYSISEKVYYGLENKDFNVYFTEKGLMFFYPERKNEFEEDDDKKLEANSNEFEKDEEVKKRVVKWHLIYLKFKNSQVAEIIGLEKQKNYFSYDEYNYDGKYYFKVPCFKKLLYKDAYPGIDIEFFIPKEGGIKYQYIIHPNGKYNQIVEQWEGINKLFLNEKGDIDILLGFTQDENIYPYKEYVLHNAAPKSFHKQNKKLIKSSFKLNSNNEYQYFLDSVFFNKNNNDDIIIDPWITNTSFPGINRAYEVQEDSIGNVYILGNLSQNSSGNKYWVQKYDALGNLLWTYQYYSIFLGDIAVDKIGNCYIIGGYCGGKRQKLNPSGTSVLWSLTGWCEEWRLAFNYDKTQLSIGGYYYNSPYPNVNLGEIDVNTGALSNMISYGLETRAIATDCDGSIYSMHFPFTGTPGSSANNKLNKTSSNFTPLGSVSNGYVLGEYGGYPTYYYAPNPDYSGC